MVKSARLSERLAQIEGHATPTPAKGVSGIEIEMATTREDRLAAARLVGRVYKTEGYLPSASTTDISDSGSSPGEALPFFSFQHLLPEARVFVAKDAGNVVGTLTVILDSPAGLPLEALYSDEVAALRARGRRVSEICSLAIDPRRERNTSWLFLNLFKQATAYLVHLTPVTDVLVTLKPSHEDFYASRLSFKSFGSWKQDARFGNADTVAMGLSREQVEELALPDTSHNRTNRILALVFGRLPKSDLRRLQMNVLEGRLTTEELDERLTHGPELYLSASADQREYLRRSYGNRLIKHGLHIDQDGKLGSAVRAPLLMANAAS